MTDPFSIIAGTAGLADVCIRFTKFLKQPKDGFQKLDKDLEDLTKEITALLAVNDLIKRSFETDLAENTNSNDHQALNDHWQAIRITLAGCQDIPERLNALMSTHLATGSQKHGKIHKLLKYLELSAASLLVGRLISKICVAI